ncbi:MucR family transcriptional regulator [Tsuneonella troitsensis]|uniref:MucR family transcriptional regulator n=1 Tax=Tsuneonella troitsensis TaxID=292222 RepID=UPI00070E6C17|nr:MucR family transcriptional regulator [Tsuneonella troitsensis]
MENHDALLELTADIIGAHVSNNRIEAEKLPGLIANVFSALSNLGAPSGPIAEKPEPAVSVRSSIKPDHLVCLVCGAKNKMLKRHLSTAHDMSPQEYRETFDLRPDYPMVSSEYAETRRELAKKIGLGRNPNQNRGRKRKPT